MCRNELGRGVLGIAGIACRRVTHPVEALSDGRGAAGLPGTVLTEADVASDVPSVCLPTK